MRVAAKKEAALEKLFSLPTIRKEERCVELEQRCEARMEHSEKTDAYFAPFAVRFAGDELDATLGKILRLIIDGVVEAKYTTPRTKQGRRYAFVRRKGNSFYLVHNVRRGGKVRQLHLARLGDKARITDQIVREVSKKHPFVELNWRALREQASQKINLADPNSPRFKS